MVSQSKREYLARIKDRYRHANLGDRRATVGTGSRLEERGLTTKSTKDTKGREPS